MTRKRRNSLITVILMIPLFAGDVVLIARGQLPLVQAGIPFVLTFLIFFGLWFFLRRRDGQKVEGDERNMKIEGRAYCYSWILTLYTLALLMLNRQLGIVELSIDQCLFLVLAVLLASFWIFKAVLGHKGDLEE
jgi:hypothetical protein